jgi:hypothetical protein
VCGRFDDRHQLVLHRSAISLSTLAQTLNNIVERILDRQIDGHGSETPSKWRHFSTLRDRPAKGIVIPRVHPYEAPNLVFVDRHFLHEATGGCH